MKRYRLPLLGAVVVAVATTGCGGGGSQKAASSTQSSSSSSGGVVKTVTIQETEYKLTPNEVTLSKPGTYVFKGVNKGSVSHALAVEGAGIDKDSEAVGPGKTTTLKVTLMKSGHYELYCPVDGHKQQGMEGTITLGSAGGAQGTTSTAPTTTGAGTGHGY
jgi:uncharacterized cupredoxin-like copper-binding protein